MSHNSLHFHRFASHLCRVRTAMALGNVSRRFSSSFPDRPIEKVADGHPSAARFSVLSYNILSDTLLGQHSELYETCDAENLSWQRRGPHIVEEIISHEPDVVCLQEVEQSAFETLLEPELGKHGFRGFHIARGGAHADGCASFYRESIFDLIESVPLKYCRNGVAVLDRMNVAFLMLLRCKRPASVSDRRDSEEVGDTTKRNASDVVLVANTHLLYNPKRGDVKLAQVMVLMAEVRKLATISSSDSSHGKFYPTVFAGDFNLVPFSPLYWFLVTGGLFYAEADQFRLSGQNSGFRAKPIRAAGPNHYLEKSVGVSNRCVFEDVSGGVLVNDKVAVTHEFGLSSVYQHFFNRDEPEFTTFHDRQCATVDYILFSSNCFLPRSGMGHLPYSQKLQLLGRRCLVRHKSLGLLGPLPNAKCPSDHLSIQAFFQFVGGPSDLADEESTSGSSKKARL